jgi:hypothetical protein
MVQSHKGSCKGDSVDLIVVLFLFWFCGRRRMTKRGRKNTREKTRGEGCLLFDGEINRQNQDSQEEQLRNLGMPDREKDSRETKQSVNRFKAG